jgi:hypothetical protein
MAASQQNGGYVVIGSRDAAVIQINHFDTRDEAVHAASGWIQQEGNEAFVIPAHSHFYNPASPKQ